MMTLSDWVCKRGTLEGLPVRFISELTGPTRVCKHATSGGAGDRCCRVCRQAASGHFCWFPKGLRQVCEQDTLDRLPPAPSVGCSCH